MGRAIDLTGRVGSPKAAYAVMLGADPTAENIRYLPTDSLIDYAGQPFRPYSDDKLRQFAADIAVNGILHPLRVRPYGEGHQILAGHNRRSAAILAGLSEVPCIVKEMDDDEAALVVVNTNLNQREELLPSEKAFAYKMRLEALKRQAGRPKNNSSQIGTNYRADSAVAEEMGESRSQIQRYIRLTYLLPEFLAMVDDKRLPMTAGEALSYHHIEQQKVLLSFMEHHGIKTITLSQAESVKALTDLCDRALGDIFGLTRQSGRPAARLGKATQKVIQQRFEASSLSDGEIAKIITEALELYDRQRGGGT